jgi:hypothetical protein
LQLKTLDHRSSASHDVQILDLNRRFAHRPHKLSLTLIGP